jgi:cytochrome P450
MTSKRLRKWVGQVTVSMPAGRELPTYMPADAAVVTTYHDVMQVLRSPKMRPEPSQENDDVSGGVLTTTHGLEHTQRRRIMNRLVRPAALEYYRDELLMPALLEEFRQLEVGPDGVHRADLVSFTRRPFVSFAAALAGFDLSESWRVDELLELVNVMGDHHRVKWFTEDHAPYIERGLTAMERFRSGYFDPAMDRCPYQPGHEVPADQHDLISLLAAQVDPSWGDQDLAVREAFTSVFAAGVNSSSTNMTNALDELTVWARQHPEGEARLDDLDFLARVLQETLRLHPTPPAFGRIATEQVELSDGRVIREGQWVALLPGGANRDPAVFGPDPDVFRPDRELPRSVARYGVSFGGGSHQCLGLRVVLGNDGVGSHAHVLRALLRAGITPDPDRIGVREPSERKHWDTYPVLFTSIDRVLDPG